MRKSLENRLRQTRSAFACGVIALGWAQACSPTPRPVSVGVDTYFYGNVDHGEKFGVSVGMPDLEAQKILTARKFRFDGKFACDFALRSVFGCKPGQSYNSFIVNELLKNGGVYLESRRSRVIAIGWSFNLLPYMDF
jgi:hypothetical protein